MAEDTDKPGLLARLKHHHLYRVVVVYAVAAWVLMQLANSVFPDFGFSRSAVRVVIVVLLSGFPVVLALGWMFIQPSDPQELGHWQKRHWKLGALLSVAAVVFVVLSGAYIWRVSERHALRTTAPAPPSVAAVFQPPPDSIVVLPFANQSGDPEQQYFSDGITEELTDALGQVPALRVIAWSTASAYRDPQLTALEVGKALKVANLLHGNILRQGDKIRVTAELVSTVTGYQLWSAHYDESFQNVFAVQDRISRAITAALQVQLAGNGPLVTPATTSSEAHEFYLRGRLGLNRGSAVNLAEAEKNFGKAIAYDPQYADAYARLAHVYIKLLQVSTLPIKTALPKSRAAANRALALDPRNVSALVALGLLDSFENQPARAKMEFETALSIDPSEATAHVDYGLVLPLPQALVQDQEAVLLDPRNDAAQNNLAADYLDLENYQHALAPALALISLSPDQIDSAFLLAFIYRQLHHDQDMVAAFDLVKPSTPLDRKMLDAGRLTYRSLLEPGLRPQALAALEPLRRVKLSPYSKLDLVQLYLALDKREAALMLLTVACAGDPVVCADLAIDPVYAPLHGNPGFEKLSRQYTTVTLQ